MATYQVGLFRWKSFVEVINRILSKALIRLAPNDLEFTEIFIRNLADLQSGLRRRLPTGSNACADVIPRQ